MNRHLTSREVIDASESTLDQRRRGHLDTCEGCRAQVAALAAFSRQLRGSGDVPEPPEAYWGHLRTRVAAELEAGREPGASRSAWGWWLLAFGAPAAVTLAVMLAPERGVPAVPVVPGVVQAPEPGLAMPAPPDGPLTPAKPAAWPEVAALTAGTPGDELVTVSVRPDTADALIDELSAAERVELLRLLRAEMGGGA